MQPLEPLHGGTAARELNEALFERLPVAHLGDGAIGKDLAAHYDGDVTRANLQPRKRERLLRKYGSTV